MPMLFWLPLIFLHAFFEMAVLQSAAKPAWFEQPNDKIEI
jgi:hypothetical protein